MPLASSVGQQDRRSSQDYADMPRWMRAPVRRNANRLGIIRRSA